VAISQRCLGELGPGWCVNQGEEMPMPIEAHGPEESTAPSSAVPTPMPHPLTSDAPAPSDADRPTGHVVTDAYAEAADPTGAVKDTKQVPEPDSLGG
jgi:hypothetical protein